jgi:hypothetical protein
MDFPIYNVYSNDDKIIINGPDSNNCVISGEGVVHKLGFFSGIVCLFFLEGNLPEHLENHVVCIGIIGMAQFFAEPTLLLMKKCEFIGSFLGFSIYRLVSGMMYRSSKKKGGSLNVCYCFINDLMLLFNRKEWMGIFWLILKNC